MGGFSGAVLLAVFAAIMAVESVARLVNPAAIAFNDAIFVAVIGLLVNGLSMFILNHKESHFHDHASETARTMITTTPMVTTTTIITCVPPICMCWPTR